VAGAPATPAPRGPSATLPLILERAQEQAGASTPPPLPAVASDLDADDDATVVVSRHATAAAMQAAVPPPFPASVVGEAGAELRAQVRAAVDEAVVTLQRAFQNHERALVEFKHRIEELERRHPAGGPSARPPPSAYPVPITAVSVAPGAPPVAGALPSSTDLSALDRDVLAALEGRARRRHLVVTTVLIFVLLFGGLSIALALSYMPHPS
jgi:hypothetical protein